MISLQIDFLEPVIGKNDKIIIIDVESDFLKLSNHLRSNIWTKL